MICHGRVNGSFVAFMPYVSSDMLVDDILSSLGATLILSG